jgi:hypothetical protein
MLNQEEIRYFFHYREDGCLLWKERRGRRVHVGDIAGCVGSSGYLQIRLDGKTFQAHRLVWLYHHGYVPENQIDHIDRNKLNNMIDNLREVTRACNARNTSNPSTNTSGVKGVRLYIPTGKWVACVKVSGKLINLGSSKDLLEAACLRLAAEQALGWSGCDASSPAFQYVKKFIPHVK